MTADRGDLFFRASGFGESAACRLAQPMRRAILRQSRRVTPFPKALAEMVRAVGLPVVVTKNVKCSLGVALSTACKCGCTGIGGNSVPVFCCFTVSAPLRMCWRPMSTTSERRCAV